MKRVIVGKNTFRIDMISLMVFIICIIFHNIPVFSVISVLVFFSYWFVILKYTSVFFIKYFYILFVATSAVLSCTVIEFSTFYLNELRINARYTGSLPLFAMSYWILFKVILIIELKYGVKIKTSNLAYENKTVDKVMTIATICVLACIMLCFIYVLPHPAFLYHLERAAYARYYGVTGILKHIETEIPRLMVFPYIHIISSKGNKRRLGIICVITAALYYVWIGNKFGMFFQMFYMFLIILSDYIKIHTSRTKLKKIIICIGISFMVILLVALGIQSITYSGSIWIYFTRRIAAQGQLWWRIFDLFNGNELHILEFGDEIISFFNAPGDVYDNIGSAYGIYKMMYVSLPSGIVDSYLRAGYRYTEGGFAAMLYYFGYIGPVIYAVLMAVFFSVCINKLSTAVNRRQYLRIFIYVRFLLMGTTSFSMFIFTPFLSLSSIIIYCYLVMTHNRSMKIAELKFS